MENKGVNIALIIGLLLGIGLCFIKIINGALTSTESLLLSFLLTILSIIASWLVSSIYSQFTFNKSLKTFALKASEKVNNLSNELDRLVVYLQQELENDDYKSVDDMLLARDIKIESTIHIINTLKSVNDRSLSDWQGVIGDELNAQKEKREKVESDISTILERLEVLNKEKEIKIVDSTDSVNSIEDKIDELNKDMRIITSQFMGLPFRRPRPSPDNETISLKCPKCDTAISCKQRKLKHEMGALKCTGCETKLYFCHENGQIKIKERFPIDEQVNCPICNSQNSVLMDPFPGIVYNILCNSCGNDLNISRKPDGINVEVKLSDKFVVDEHFIDKVRELLPSQPWPKGVAQEISKKLNVNLRFVQTAINELIKRKVFKQQIDGVLYDITEVKL